MSPPRRRRDVAIISFAQLPPVPRDTAREEAELVQPVAAAALRQAGLTRKDIGFTVSGSCDFLLGRPFSFVSALDGVAAPVCRRRLRAKKHHHLKSGDRP